MEEITGKIQISSPQFAELQKRVKNIAEFQKECQDSLAKKTTELLEIIVGGGLTLNASDIHLEPQEENAKIRVRVDGILQDVIAIDRAVYEAVLARIKLLSGLKLNIANRPQDGRFSVLLPPETDNLVIEVRTSTLPAEKGEAIVLRLLNPKSLIGMEKLGLRKDLLEIFKREIRKPNGMVIVTGPTGSGKTTTLYAFLKEIQKPEIKIITIEDPIEYHLKGVSQTQVASEKGYDFASGLKSIMRQDPDVILVGEIRDLETVETALQAALTGHLVLTTLHTNDAAGTVARLTNLGAKPSNIGPAVNLAVAQRLIRQICPKCGQLKKISAQDLQKIKKELQGVPQSVKIPKLSPDLKIPQIKGCKICNSTGYKGRIGIFEGFLMDEEVERFVLANPSIAALRKKAMDNGMVSMKQDGFIKVLEGMSTLAEVERVTGE